MDLQDRIIRRHRLERDVRVPSVAGEFTGFGEGIDDWCGAFFDLYAADYGDLVAELAACFGDGVDVETGGGGLR